MNQNTLDKKAMSIIKDKLSFAMLNTITEICMYSEEKKDFTYNVPQYIEDYKSDILLNFKNLENILCKDIEQRKDEILYLENKIQSFEKDAISFFACLNFCDLISSIVSDYYQLKTIVLDTDKKLPIDKTINDICSLIDFEEREGDILKNGSILLSVIPYSMTKENYKDYIIKSFKYLFEGATKGIIENSVNTFKFKFSSLEQMEDGAIKNRLIDICNINFEEKSQEELLNILEEIEAIAKDYAQIIGDISAIYSSLMELLAIINFTVDKNYLFEDDFLLKDIFYSTKEMIEDETFEIMSDTILEKCEENLEKLIDKIESEEKQLKNIVKNQTYDKLTNTVKIVIALDEYLGVNLEKNILFKSHYTENDEKVTEELIIKKADEFVSYVNNLKFSNKLLKRLKQQFFFYIPCPFNASFLKNHFSNVLSNLPEKMEILTSYKLFAFTNPKEFSEFLNESKHTHIHNESCGCKH